MRRLPFFLGLGLLCSLLGCKEENSPQAGPAAQTGPQQQSIQQQVRPLTSEQDLDVLLEQIGESKYVLLGEASHGTAEFYTWRAALTRRLIAEKGFRFVAVEGDWPDAYEVNRYLKESGTKGRERQVLQNFDRWPTWMWANEEIADLTRWLREYNNGQPAARKAGFYGLDVYSLWESLERLQIELTNKDPQLAQAVIEAAQCFVPYRQNEQAYASATVEKGASCAAQLMRLLQAVRTKYPHSFANEESFNAEQNALVAVNAERYYYQMVRSDAESWNVRDRHMMESLNRLMRLHGPDAKAIIWAHNTHVGDARYTDMAADGMVNLGQLVREEHASQGVYIVGFDTYQGSVIAGDYWGAPAESMTVPKAPANSWEGILHTISPDNKIVLLSGLRNEPANQQKRGQRAIGVVYNPSSEGRNYVPTVLPERYDALLFIDQTHALHPLPVPAGGRKDADAQGSFPVSGLNF